MNKVLGIGVVLALVLGFVGAMKPAKVEKVVEVGANPGPEKTEHQFMRASATVGGGVHATTSQGTVTYPASTFVADNSLIVHTATAATTANLPASSTLAALVPKAGDSRTFYFQAVTNNVTLAGGTGTELNTASSTKVMTAGGLGVLKFVRKSNSDIEVLMVSGF